MANTKMWYFLLDQLFAAVIVAPFTVAYWRGTWYLCQFYFFPDDVEKSAWLSVAIGDGGTLLLALFQGPLTKLLGRDRLCSLGDVLVWVFGYHLYSYAMCFFIVNKWRGCWDLWNFYTGTEPWSNATSLAIGTSLMLLLRVHKNTIGPPCSIIHDWGRDFFQHSTRFRVKPSLHENFFWDCILLIPVIHSLVVFYWRGAWELMNNYWYNDDATKTVWISLASGYGVFFLCTPLQLILHWAYKRIARGGYNKVFLVIVDDTVFLLASFSAVAVWRGIWIGIDQLILTNDFEASLWLTHAVGIVVLWMFRCAHSIIPRGCLIDGDADAPNMEDAAMYPNYYFRRFLLKKSESVINSDKTENDGKKFGSDDICLRPGEKVYTVDLPSENVNS